MAEDIVLIPLPKTDGGLTYAAARLVHERGQAFAEAVVAIPETRFAPPKRTSLSPLSLTLLREGSNVRPALYFYEGMILAGPG